MADCFIRLAQEHQLCLLNSHEEADEATVLSIHYELLFNECKLFLE